MSGYEFTRVAVGVVVMIGVIATVSIFIFLLTRKAMLWYWKVDQIAESLNLINQQLYQLRKENQ